MNVASQLRIATQHHRHGNLLAALSAYDAILDHFPNHPDALHLSGLIAHQQGRSSEAVHRIMGAIKQQPENTVFLKNIVLILFAVGNGHMCNSEYRKAAVCFGQAIEYQPANADLHQNLGVACQEMGQVATALSHYRRAIELNPELAEAYYNLANLLRMTAGPDELVLAAYRSALSIRPDYMDASYNMAKALDELERIDEAIDCYSHTLMIAPDFVDAHNGQGNAYLKQGRYRAAMACYEQAIRLQPHFQRGYYNLALASKQQGKLNVAAAYANHALGLNPNYGDGASLLVQIQQQACAWSQLKISCKQLDAITRAQLKAGKRPSEQPFLNFTRHADPAMNLQVAHAWSEDQLSRISSMGGPLANEHRKQGNGKIVVGYVSERFRNAATAHLLLQLFGLHDRRRFTVFAYSYGKDDNSSYRKRIVRDVDRFIDIRHLNDPDAARRIRDDGVDILVDLMGYMKHNRMGIFAFRPAPVQVAYLGYPSTTGADFMDYLIADHVVAPVGEDAFFSEHLVRMPHCYQINDNTQKVSDTAFRRNDCGLPENAFVYCSFNADYKIEPFTFQCWMNILTQVSGSVLWLMVRSPEAQKNLIEAAVGAGIEPDRLVFAQTLPKEDHLARIKLADLALDTRIVNGHTTTSDCLWAGLPVVTVKGDHFASRVSASLLEAIGLPDLVCDSLEMYQSLAVGLAMDHRRLSAIQKRLAENKTAKPLFDSVQTVRSLETAYAHMWENHAAGKEPGPFAFPVAGDMAGVTATKGKL